MATDREVVAAVLTGDTEAFRHLVVRYQACVFGVAMGHVQDPEAARDVAQEVFLRAFLSLPDLRDVEALPSWLHTIAVSTSHSWHRRNQAYLRMRDRVSESDPYGPAPERPDELLERQEIRLAVRDAVSALPDHSRVALALYYMDGLSTAEAGRFLGISEAAVRQRISRARRQLQQEVASMVDADLGGREVPESFAAEVESLIDRARELLSQGEYQQAIEALAQARTADPEDSIVAILLADLYREYGQASADGAAYRDQAIAILSELVDRDPGNIMVRLLLAEIRSVTGNIDELIEEHERNLADSRGGPFEPFALLRIARVHGPRRRRAEAARYYEELIAKEPRLAGLAYSELAHGALLDDDLAQARELYQEALSAHDTLGGAFADYARQLLGERLWRFHGGADPRHALRFQDQVWLAGVCAKDGDTEGAGRHLQEAAARLNSPDLASEKPKLAEYVARMVKSKFAELADLPTMRQITG